ncbi:tripartite tricarboxylate transporter substrate binding protein [soil metagenome]
MTLERRIHRCLAAAVAIGALFTAGTAAAQASNYPSRPIRFIVPFGPGSGTDTSARYFAEKLQKITGQAVIVENKAGGNGFIAVNTLKSAPADGYTVFVGSNSTLAVNVALFRKLPYDPVTEFAPLTMMMRAPAVLAVPVESKYTSVASLIAAAKAAPGKLNYGAGSAGYQLMGELFNDMAQVKVEHVPFKSAAEALTATMGSTVDMTFSDITAAYTIVSGGKLRALAVASDHRSKALPDVPTMAEAGLPGYTAYVWVAAAVLKDTPKAEVDKLAGWLTQIEQMPETQAFYERLGAETMKGGPQEMHDFQVADIVQWKRIATKAKVELE